MNYHSGQRAHLPYNMAGFGIYDPIDHTIAPYMDYLTEIHNMYLYLPL